MNAHIPNEQRATVLSLVNTLKSVYIGAAGLVIGRIAELSLSFLFAALGLIVLGGSFFLRLNESHTEVAEAAPA